MTEDSWRETPEGAAAAAHVAAYFRRCLKLFELGRLDDVEDCLARDRWCVGVDLSQVPPRPIAYTEALTAKARGLAEHGDPDVIGEVLLRIIALWPEGEDRA